MFQTLFGTFDIILALQLVSKVLLSLVLGGLVGLERERHNMPAGVRTFMLVSAGSCIFTVLSLVSFGPIADHARVAAQIVSGIGFLGAGVVMQRKGNIYGLTSAAGIWAVAAVGMAVGTGNYFLAIFGAIAIFVVLGILRQALTMQAIAATRRTLTTELRTVRAKLQGMGTRVTDAIQDAVKAVVDDDHDLARQIISADEQLNRLRYQVEEECLDILGAHRPKKTQLRTVLATTHVAVNLERMGDYAKAIAQVRLQMGHEPLLTPLVKTPLMADQVCEMVDSVLDAFGQDDVARAERISQAMLDVNQLYDDIVQSVTEKMTEKKSKHFERGAYLLTIAHNLKRVGERATNIAEQIIFVRTGTLQEIDRDDWGKEE